MMKMGKKWKLGKTKEGMTKIGKKCGSKANEEKHDKEQKKNRMLCKTKEDMIKNGNEM